MATTRSQNAIWYMEEEPTIKGEKDPLKKIKGGKESNKRKTAQQGARPLLL